MANEVVLINGVTKREKDGNYVYDFPRATIDVNVAEDAYVVTLKLDYANPITSKFADVTDKLGQATLQEYVDELAVQGNYFEIAPVSTFSTPLIPDTQRVNLFSLLPDPTTVVSQYWIVDTKEVDNESGIYKSNGVSWLYIGVDVDSIIPPEWVFVETLTDFPTPIGGYIPLEDKKVYQIFGNVDIGANGLDFGTTQEIKIQGNFASIDKITSTKAGDFIIGSDIGIGLESLSIINNTCTNMFNVSNGGAKVFFANSCKLFGTGAIGSISIFSAIIMRLLSASNFTDGLSFAGTNGVSTMSGIMFLNCSGTLIDLGVSTHDSFEVSSVTANIGIGDVGINIAPAGANINANGEGIISGVRIDNSTGGDSIIGYSPLDLKWNVYGNSESIITSDRITPTGWGNYRDGEIAFPTQVITTVAQKLLIDGVGAQTDIGFLPKSIRGTGNLWDTVNNKITPISDGDSYDLRVDIEVTAKTGSVSEIIVELDIGGAAAPTNVIVTSDVSVSKTPPFTKSVNILIFDRATFLANGGQLFLSTDAGTATVSARGIVISRNSSGSS